MYRRRGLLLFLSCAGLTSWLAAATPPVVSATAVQQAIPVVSDGVGLVKEVARIPADVGEVLLLPLGVVECVAAPLPGVSVGCGLRHIGTGLLAPFHLVRDVLTLPYDAAVAVGGACEHVVPGA